jgi:hypothetical protein
MGHHCAPPAAPPPAALSSRTARRLGGLALAAISLAGVGCTKTNDAVATAPASSPAATSPPGTVAPATSPPKTETPKTEAPKKVPSDEVDVYKATVTANGKDQTLNGVVLCRTLDDGQVRLVFGKEGKDDVDFRMTFPEDLTEDGTIDLYDGDTKTGSGTASINAEQVSARGGRGIGFGFSAGFTFDSGDDTGTGTMTGTGACALKSAPDETTTSTRPARSTTSKANRPAPSRTLEVPAQDAVKLADDLTALALESYVDTKSWNPGDAWVAAGMPGDKVMGYGNVVDGKTAYVSGFEVLVDKKSGVTYLAFAAADVNGGCAYGSVTVGDGVMPPYGRTDKSATQGPCSGTAAAKDLGFG